MYPALSTRGNIVHFLFFCRKMLLPGQMFKTRLRVLHSYSAMSEVMGIARQRICRFGLRASCRIGDFQFLPGVDQTGIADGIFVCVIDHSPFLPVTILLLRNIPKTISLNNCIRL